MACHLCKTASRWLLLGPPHQWKILRPRTRKNNCCPLACHLSDILLPPHRHRALPPHHLPLRVLLLVLRGVPVEVFLFASHGGDPHRLPLWVLLLILRGVLVGVFLFAFLGGA